MLAEDIRVEVNGKSMIIGFLGLSPWVTIGVPFPNLPVQQLSFLCLSGDPVEIGQYAIQFSILDPTGEPLIAPLTQTIEAARPSPLGAIFQARMLPLKGVGKYGLNLTVNGNADREGSFTIIGEPRPALR